MDGIKNIKRIYYLIMGAYIVALFVLIILSMKDFNLKGHEYRGGMLIFDCISILITLVAILVKIKQFSKFNKTVNRMVSQNVDEDYLINYMVGTTSIFEFFFAHDLSFFVFIILVPATQMLTDILK